MSKDSAMEDRGNVPPATRAGRSGRECGRRIIPAGWSSMHPVFQERERLSTYAELEMKRKTPCGTSTGDVTVVTLPFGRDILPADPLTERSRAIWAAGDYDAISAGFRLEAEAFV